MDAKEKGTQTIVTVTDPIFVDANIMIWALELSCCACYITLFFVAEIETIEFA